MLAKAFQITKSFTCSKTSLLNMSTASEKIKVFVTQPIPLQALEILKRNNLEVIVNEEVPLPRSDFFKAVSNCHALFCTLNEKIDKELLDSAENLRTIGTCSVGYDHIDMRACESRGIKVGYTPGVLTDATAEYTVGLLLNTSRRISEAINAAKKNEWGNWKISWMCGQGLSGSKVGIFGLGRIGLAIAKRLKNFETEKILYHNRSINAEAEKCGFEYVPLDTLFAESDFLIVACALTKETKKFFDLEVFKKMKKNVIFINVSRGDVVNQDDLCIALKDGIIGAAGIDVTSPEPLPVEHELYRLKNCVISPHICSAETNTRVRMATITANNIVQAINEKPMIHQIKF